MKYTGKLWDVFKSKRFISSLVVILLTGLSAYVPELEDNFEEVSMIAIGAIVALVSGYSLQEIAILIVTGGQLPVIEDETPTTEETA